VLERSWACLAELLARGGECRLLFSTPRLGPAGGLLQQGGPIATPPAAATLLQAAARAEASGLDAPRDQRRLWQRAAEHLGWGFSAESWSEALSLEISEAVLERWLAPDSAYRTQLAGLGADQQEQLAILLRQARGQVLPQEIEHTRLIARR
jgi:putative ATPase